MSLVHLDEVVVTAQYEPTHYKSAVHRVEIIQKDAIKNRGAVTLEQALAISSSIRIYNDPILGTSARLRGIGSGNVAILIDGVPVIGRLDGNIDLSQISMQNVERIEVVEGALSNIYGNNAAGGVINIITKKGQIQKWSVDLESQFESIGQQNYQARTGFRQGKFTAAVHGRYFQYDEHPVDSLRLLESVLLADSSTILQSKFPFNPKEQYGIGGLLRFDLDTESSIIAKFDYNEEDVTDYGPVKRPQFNPYGNDLFYNTIRTDYSLQFKKKWSRLFIDITTAYNEYDRIVEEKRFYLESQTFDSLLQFADTTKFNTIFNRSVAAYDLSNDLKVVAGMTFAREKGSGQRILNHTSTDSSSAVFTEIAPFVDLKYTGIDRLSLSVSGRYTSHSEYDAQFTPSILAKYDLNDNLTLRAGYTVGYRSPALKELYLEFIDINHNIIGNANLVPELSRDVQMTVDYTPLPELNLSVNMFATKIRDQISLFEYEDLKFQYDNVDSYTVLGIQPSLDVSIKHIEIQSSATIGFWDTQLETSGAPRYGEVFDLNTSVTYSLDKYGLGIAVNHRHTGSQPRYRLDDEEVSIRTIESFDIVDLSISKTFLANRIKLISGVRNLLGISTIDVTGGGSGGAHGSVGRSVISQGRSWFVNIAFALHP